MDEPGESANPHALVDHAEAAGPQRRVFISYASNDAALAQKVCSALEATGLLCWIAPRDVLPGTLYADAIVSAIDESSILVLVLSKEAVASAHVGRELERAASKRHPIIALRTDTAPLTRAFEYFLNQSQWIETGNGGLDAAIAQLTTAAARHLPLVTATPPANVPAQRASSQTPRPRRFWIPAGAGAVAALIAAYLLADWAWLQGHTAPKPMTGRDVTIANKSIAVLPFTDMSEKKDQEYFADGMAEEIIDLLVKIPGLKVIGRTSSFQFKGENQDLRAIGARLGVAYVVEGSVRRSGDQIRVTAQLIDSATGAHAWSEHFDRNSGDVLKIEDEIAAALVRAMQITVGAADPLLRPTLKSTEAYNLYLKGRHALDRTDEEGFDEGARDFKQALELDPTSAATAAWLSETYELQAEFGLVPPAAGFEQARRAAQDALASDPNLAIAHVVLGGVHTAYDWDWAEADNELKLALALAPGDSMATFYAARLLIDQGRWSDALTETNAALAADPLWPLPYQGLDVVQLHRGHLREAELAARRLIELSPSYLSGHYYLGLVLLERGDPEDALTAMQEEAPEGGRNGGLAMAYYALGRKAESDDIVVQMIKEPHAFPVAEVYAFLGDRDKAIQWLERAYFQKEPDMQYIKSDLPLRNLENDPRYRALLRKMNLPE
jgi:adenylate cyclase